MNVVILLSDNNDDIKEVYNEYDNANVDEVT